MGRRVPSVWGRVMVTSPDCLLSATIVPGPGYFVEGGSRFAVEGEAFGHFFGVVLPGPLVEGGFGLPVAQGLFITGWKTYKGLYEAFLEGEYGCAVCAIDAEHSVDFVCEEEATAHGNAIHAKITEGYL